MAKDILIENINTPEMLSVALKRLRKNSGMSQDQLANIINMRQATISDLENGRGTLESLFKVIQALKLNLVLSNLNTTKARGSNSKPRKILDLLND